MAEPLDPIALEILWGRLVSIVDESASALQRTSFSTTVRESNDFACVLLAPDGTALAENTLGVPSFAGVMSIVMHHFLKVYPAETWRPGDVGLTNDPWLNTGHLPDTTIITPIFHGDVLVAFSGNTAHKIDMGGAGYVAESRDVYQEGLRIPICKLYEGGQVNSTLMRMIHDNVRLPDSVIGDLHAQMAAGHVCALRVREFLDEQGIRDMSAIGQAVQERAESAMRAAIRRLPDGEYSSVVMSDGFDQPTEIRTHIVIAGDQVTVDFAGTSLQVPRGINAVYNYTYAFACYTLKCLLDPMTRKNEGSYKPFNIVVPEGSILNAKFPAPVMVRSMTGHFVSSGVLLAMAQALPEHVIADSGSCPGLRVKASGLDAQGRHFAVGLYANGGMGARAGIDGLSATGFPTNAGGGSIEVQESLAPLLFWRRELLEDSGGPGRQRGGLGQLIEIESISEQALSVTMQFDRIDHPATGLFGGQPGGKSRLRLNGTKPIPGKGTIRLTKGDRVTVEYAGGGGYGPPADRSRAAVRDDLEDGLISAAAARDVYRLEGKVE